MGLQNIIRWLLPREEHFFDILERQSNAVRDGSVALARFGEGEGTLISVRDAVQEWEHQGDRLFHEMEDALALTFVTPLDREDLHRLSAELDGVLDLANAAIRACDMLGVESPTVPMKRLIALILQSSELIQRAVPLLRKHDYAQIVALGREIRKIEKQGDRVYREAISELFRNPNVDAKVIIREQSVLDDLENAIDACEAVAKILGNLAVKHG
jgi:uncharacterized protein Yka (UPF0111/DUF47 family)